jgi:hypothetical protein
MEPLKVEVQADSKPLDELKQKAAAAEAQIEKLFNQGDITSAIKYEKQLANIQQQMTKLGAAAATAGTTSSRGILQAAYAIDDLQYGFRSIVNNIPQVALAIGGPHAAAIAGAAGIAAVAISQLMNHWSDLSSLWSEDTSGKLPKLREGIEGLVESLKKISTEVEHLQSLQEARKAGETGPSFWGVVTGSDIKGDQRLEKLKELSREAKERLDDEKAIASIRSKEEQETESAVRKALENLPGGTADVLGQLRGSGFGENDAKKVLGRAIRGDASALDDVLFNLEGGATGRFKELFQAMPAARAEKKEWDLKAKEGEAEQHQLKEERKEAEKLRKERLKEEQKNRIAILEDQRDSVKKQMDDANEQAWQARHRGGQPQILQGAKAVVDMYQQAAGGNRLEQIAKQQHAAQLQGNKKLDEIAKEIKKERAVVLK